MAKRVTDTEVDARINTVYDLLLAGLTRTQLLRHCTDLWDLGERQIETYIQRARDLQRLDAELERPQWLMAALSRLQDYERRASEKGNFSSAMRALEMQARLLRFEVS